MYYNMETSSEYFDLVKVSDATIHDITSKITLPIIDGAQEIRYANTPANASSPSAVQLQFNVQPGNLAYEVD